MTLHLADQPVLEPRRTQGRSSTDAASSNLRGAVLLAGAVRTSRFRRSPKRFLLELPVDGRRCVMDIWHEHLTRSAIRFDLEHLPARVIVDRTTPIPAHNAWSSPQSRCNIRFEQDPFDYRGTGGLLRDLATQYEANDYLVIAYAAQVLFEPLDALIQSLADREADVAIACGRDGTPAGIMLVRCGCLGVIPPVGFIDLNEQALPLIAKSHDVRVLRGDQPVGAPIRTLTDYLDTLRRYHRRQAGHAEENDPFHEDWQASFRIVEPGAHVAASAVVHDSVVLEGGRVDEDAVVVRSLVCPGGVVSHGAWAIDRVVNNLHADNGR